MSRAFFDSFFPVSSRLLQESKYTQWLYNVSFPAQTAQLCPESRIGNDIFVRNPILCCYAVGGILLGFYGAFLLSRKHSPLWTIAFHSFAVMNVAAIPLHCLLPLSPHPETVPLWWAVDTYSTGASSTAICLVTLSSSFTVKDWALVNSFGLMAIYIFFQSYRYTFPLEFWYVVPTLLAGQLALLWLCLSNTKVSQRALALLSGIAATMISSLFVDPWCCSRGIRMLDAFTSPSMLFLSCDLAFGVLLWYLLNNASGCKAKSQKKDS